MPAFVKSDTRLPMVGDIVFARSSGLAAKLIRVGERIKFKGKGDIWNHVCVVDRIVDGKVYVLQATPKGVTNDKTIDTIGDYLVIEPPMYVDKVAMSTFGRSQLNAPYGWTSILTCIFDLWTPSWFPSIRRPGSFICSALVAETLRAGGWFTPHSNWPDIYVVTPSELFTAFTLDNIW